MIGTIKLYTALYEAGKLVFKSTGYPIAKRKAIFNQRKYGRLTALITC